ncbi:DNA replication/repair protein RecF [bacterium]|nr:MAG: DNA replication/repair protein RecF [bacterium]
MQITQLRLNDFRNYTSAELSFCEGINFIQGHNGQGKTSVLEAIYFLCLSRSFKTQDDTTAIRFEMPYFDIEGRFHRSSLEMNARAICHRTEGKSVLIDKKRLDRLSELVGKFPSVVSSPEDVQIVSGSPGNRRRWIDIALSQMHGVYLKDLQEYRQALRQRNALLNSPVIRPDNLDVWDKELAQTGSTIILRRMDFLKSFSGLAEQVYRQIAADKETVDMEYKTSIAGSEELDGWTEAGSTEKIQKAFLEQLRSGREREIQRKLSLFGPHKDDIVLLLNKKSIRDYGSQGQLKTMAIALKFAEFLYMADRLDQKPLLLLDDVFSELDWDRRKHLMNYLENAGQVFLTSADEGMKFDTQKKIRYFSVENGHVMRQE